MPSVASELPDAPDGGSSSISAAPEPANASRSGAGKARGERATLGSVAARAGVSRQTVSNVLNSPQLVRADTAERVRAAIAELSYRPHLAAQQLRTRRSQ